MGEVIPVTLRANSGSSSVPNYGTVSAGIDEGSSSVGQDLHKARLRRAKTLLEVSSKLKILPDYLTAIEMGRFEDLPARVYAVGYVRSYAAYLGLDAQTLGARFKAELISAGLSEPAFNPLPPPDGEGSHEQEAAASAGKRSSILRLPSLPENALSQVAGVLILIGAAAFSVYHVISAAPQIASPFASLPTKLATDAGLANEPIAAPLASEIPNYRRLSETPALHEVAFLPPLIDLRLVTVEEPKLISVEPVSPEPTELASIPPAHPPIPVRKEPRTSVSPQRTIVASDEAGATQRVSAGNTLRLKLRHEIPLGRHFGIDNTDSRIILRVHGATAVKVGDNRKNVFFDRVLGAGDTYRVPNLIGLKLSALDAGAIEIIVDDTTVGFAGKDGVPAREISLDPKALAHPPRGG